MIQADFIVAAQEARLGEPAKGTFHDPPLGKHLEAFGVVAPPHNLQLEFAGGAKLFDPANQFSQIATIGPDDLNAVIHREHQSDEMLVELVGFLKASEFVL
jgi:hypothetical protein